MNQGICGLCHRANILKVSHYLPSSLYDLINKSRDPVGSAPVIVNAESGTSIQINRQEKKPYLCEDCEDLFSKFGEKFVISDCYRGPTEFKLQNALDSSIPTNKFDDSSVFFGNTLKASVNVESYFYFALSILWRGSSTKWGSSANAFQQKLGTYYEEIFRNFLLNPVNKPKNIFVQVCVDCDDPVLPIMRFPVSIGTKEYGSARCKVHTFFIPGMRFMILVGGQLTTKCSDTVDSSCVTFFTWSFRESRDYRETVKAVKASQPKGKLAKNQRKHHPKS